MTPGPIEEAGQTARSLIGALSSQPFALAMIVSNFLLLGFVWYSQIENNRQRAQLGQAVFDLTKETNELIAKCGVRP